MPIDDELEGEFDYDTCNCDQVLHLKQLLEEVLNEVELDQELEERILQALNA